MLAGLSLLQERYIFIIFPWPFVIFHICQMRKQINAKSSVIRQKANLKSQSRGNKKAKHAKFSKKSKHNVRFSENLACFAFLLPQFWDSPFCIITDEICQNPYTLKISVQKKGSAYINPFLVFLCFQGVLNGEISQIWVNSINVILSLIF